MTGQQYEQLTSGAKVLSRDRHGDKVLSLADGRVLKLFRRKRLLSSGLFFPYAQRFAAAAEKLAQRGIPAVRVRAVLRISDMHRDAVVYDYLPGQPLREAAERNADLLDDLARFMAELHAKGVYFRAIHLGNVLVQPDGALGLIDVSEARFSRGGLSVSKRARNFKPLLRYQQDLDALAAFGFTRFLNRYIEAAGLSACRAGALRRRVVSLEPRFASHA